MLSDSSTSFEMLADSRRRQPTLGVLLLRHELRRLGVRHRDQRRLVTSRHRVHQFSHQGKDMWKKENDRLRELTTAARGGAKQPAFSFFLYRGRVNRVWQKLEFQAAWSASVRGCEFTQPCNWSFAWCTFFWSFSKMYATKLSSRCGRYSRTNSAVSSRARFSRSWMWWDILIERINQRFHLKIRTYVDQICCRMRMTSCIECWRTSGHLQKTFTATAGLFTGSRSVRVSCHLPWMS